MKISNNKGLFGKKKKKIKLCTYTDWVAIKTNVEDWSMVKKCPQYILDEKKVYRTLFSWFL